MEGDSLHGRSSTACSTVVMHDDDRLILVGGGQIVHR